MSKWKKRKKVRDVSEFVNNDVSFVNPLNLIRVDSIDSTIGVFGFISDMRTVPSSSGMLRPVSSFSTNINSGG